MNKINNFEPSKKKALITATAEQAFEESRAVIQPLATAWPQGAIALNVLLASAGTVIKYKQEVLNQFTEYLMKNPEVFTGEVINSREFQDGLVVFINSYFKLRSDTKLGYARKIFFNFGISKEKPVYPLERYDDTLEKISDNGIRLLGFINTEIPLISEKYLEKQMYSNSNVANDEATMQRFRKSYIENKALSFFVDEYIKGIADDYAKDHDSIYAKAHADKTAELHEQFWIGVSELEQLGIIRTYTNPALGWSAIPTSEYRLTDYGSMFISVIKP